VVFHLCQELRDLHAGFFAQRKVERNAVEGAPAQRSGSLADGVGARGRKTGLRGDLADDREMKAGVFDDEEFVAHDVISIPDPAPRPRPPRKPPGPL